MTFKEYKEKKKEIIKKMKGSWSIEEFEMWQEKLRELEWERRKK